MFINKIRNSASNGDVPDYIYEEYKQKRLIDFDNLTKSPALNYANRLAMSMNYIKRNSDE